MVNSILEGVAFSIVVAQGRALIDRFVFVEPNVALEHARLITKLVADRRRFDVEIKVVVLSVATHKGGAGLKLAIPRLIRLDCTAVIHPVLEGTALSIFVAQVRALVDRLVGVQSYVVAKHARFRPVIVAGWVRINPRLDVKVQVLVPSIATGEI